MQLGELICTVLIGEKWKIEIQKHHYRLCFHIRALLIYYLFYASLYLREGEFHGLWHALLRQKFSLTTDKKDG